MDLVKQTWQIDKTSIALTETTMPCKCDGNTATPLVVCSIRYHVQGTIGPSRASAMINGGMGKAKA